MSGTQKHGADSYLSRIVRIIGRHFRLVVGVTLVLAAISGAVIFFGMGNLYLAEALVLLDTRKEKISDIKDVLVEGPPDDESILSEMQIIQSRDMAFNIIDKLSLIDKSEFQRGIEPKSSVFKQLAFLKTVADAIIPLEVAADESEIRTPLDQVTDMFLERLNVKRKGASRVVSVSFLSEDPNTAADVANAVVDHYVGLAVQAKVAAAERATQWLKEQVELLGAKAAEAERAVENFRERADLLEGPRGFFIAQQVADVTTQLSTATAVRVEAESRLRELEFLVGKGRIVEASQVASSQLIETLRAQEVLVMRKKAELSQTHGNRHPEMIRLDSDLADLQRAISGELANIGESQRKKVAIARAQELALGKQLNELKASLSQANRGQVGLNGLDRQAQASRGLLQSFLARVQETKAQADVSAHQPDSRIISRAIPPETPYISKMLVFLGAITISGIAGIGCAIATEQLNRGLRSCEELKDPVRMLGLVPSVHKTFSSRKPELYVLDAPASLLAESVRSFYTRLRLIEAADAWTSVLFTSAHAGEGKTTLALCLGRLRAHAGGSCVIVEADIRRPAVCSRLGLSSNDGLCEFLRGGAEIDSILLKDPASEARVVAAGTCGSVGIDLLHSPRMSVFIDNLKERFHLVILDGPPILAVSDTRILARQADAAVMVVRWAKTKRETVDMALAEITEDNGHIAGIVMNMVDIAAHARCGFGDSSYFSRKTLKYYR